MRVRTMCRQLTCGGWEEAKSGLDPSKDHIKLLNLMQWCGSMEGWGSLRICPECEIIFLSRGNGSCYMCMGKIEKPKQKDVTLRKYVTMEGYRQV